MPVLANALVITSWDMSILFWSRSEMVCFTYLRNCWTECGTGCGIWTHSSAPFTSRLISILLRHVSMTVDTRRQLSRRTVWKEWEWVKGGTEQLMFYLDTLGVHLIMPLWPGPIEARVTLFTDKEIWIINLLKLELDRFDEFCCDEVRSLAAWLTSIKQTHSRSGPGTHRGPSRSLSQ